ncbi:GNAT family N-acetyltransferase [Frigidibacter sp. MR17.24]|uniref:GNAT family N-acetyltransferase n=1 Tax=Frigidibacter sp. MR17.24 TaxID=3127345 RepID=UPI0030130BF1
MIRFRDATEADLTAILALLRDDTLGAAREAAGDLAPYRAAFARIAAAPDQQLVVGEDAAGAIVATCQLSVLPGLSNAGRIRGQIEAVRVASHLRSQGIGAALMAEAERRLRAAGCGVMQLTTDRSRTRAHAFYEGLGFTATHIGYKRTLT